MADYDVQTSGSTTMRIRDTGGTVEFWFLTGSQTWNNEQPWGYEANGSSSGVLQFRLLRGGFWQKFGEVYVGYDQDVRFTIIDAGLGFPSYDFVQHISRSTVPFPPYIYETYAVSATHIYVEFEGTNDGGSAVLEWQIGYGSNPNSPDYYWSSGGASTIGPFSSGQKVYFWARARNAIGWSDWSNRTDAFTWRIPDAPNPIAFADLTQTSLRTLFYDRGWGGTTILERQLGYGLDPVTPSSFVSVDSGGQNVLTDLVPGQTYYFWGRSRNVIGWGPWSTRSQTNLIAGARVLVGSVWKRAVPYVKVAGVWRVAYPWVKDAGVWKKPIV